MKEKNVRVRFAPSPTGPLHIGGVRTALYNYLFAKKQGGQFILRIEDTDQNRYVEGAEAYIYQSMKWLGLGFDESPVKGGEYGPYRQSERKDMYAKYAQQLVDSDKAYYAFDTTEELDAMRQRLKESKSAIMHYGPSTRMSMNNSLSLVKADVEQRINDGQPYVIRLKMQPGREISFRDRIRGDVHFKSDLLDDKVIFKSDGMPTYHLANVVDDYLMKISHVIRGEEWLSSTAHHVFLYEAFGWADAMPQFAHLPLIFKPTGKGKLSKRDGSKFGIPVFPLSWTGARAEDSFEGFDDFGFLPEAVLNFLAMLGWHPETEQEIFNINQLQQSFSLARVGKSGAIFDFEKATWFNQQYLHNLSDDAIRLQLKPMAQKAGYEVTDKYLAEVIQMMKPRVSFIKDILKDGYYFFEPVRNYDRKALKKKWKPEKQGLLDQLASVLESVDRYLPEYIEQAVKDFMEKEALGPGQVFPLLRLALAGSLKGPGIFEIAGALGQYTSVKRLRGAGEEMTKTLLSVNE